MNAAEGVARGFVRALWGLEVSVSSLPATNELSPERPRFLESSLWLPSAALGLDPKDISHFALAASAHVAAHLRFGARRFLIGSLKPVQVAIISLLEDARVERLAVEHYPGLARLWAPFHAARDDGAKTSGALLARLARALHDDIHADADDDGWVSKARQLFFAGREEWHDPTFVRRLGGRLGNDLGQMRVQFNAKDYVVQPAYRDDNVGLWQFEQASASDGTEAELEGARRVTEEQPFERAERTRGAPQTVNERAESLGEPQFALRVKESAAQASPLRYPEWDYVIARERAAFCSLLEKPAPPSNPRDLEEMQARYAPARRRLRLSAARLAQRHPVHARRLSAGDRLDLPAATAAVVALASGTHPDPRVYRRVRFQPEPPALLVLLDCSESLNAVPPGGSNSVLSLARGASALLASTLHGATRDWAIHGFCSNGRHDVGYSRFKDFDQPYDERARARLCGMRAQLSTRLGTALRHAGKALRARHARRKLLLVLTDGEPSDVDVHDAKYLLFDARRATQLNRAAGVTSFCLGLDPSAESSVRCIFGTGNYLLCDRLDQLPETLSRLYLRLAH